MRSLIVLTLWALPVLAASNHGGRVIVPLDGNWQVADSVTAGDIPSSFNHTVPVPGLANLAVPAFPDVDKFDSREAIARSQRSNPQPASALNAPDRKSTRLN